MKYNGVIQRKLALLDDQVLRLQTHLRDIPRERFVEDWVLRSMAERALQVAVEIVIDIAERIVSIENAGPAATAGEAIQKLVELGILRNMEPYRKMVGFRNLIVHQYEQIDPEFLFTLVTERLGDFRRFRDELDAVNAAPNSPNGTE